MALKTFFEMELKFFLYILYSWCYYIFCLLYWLVGWLVCLSNDDDALGDSVKSFAC